LLIGVFLSRKTIQQGGYSPKILKIEVTASDRGQEFGMLPAES